MASPLVLITFLTAVSLSSSASLFLQPSTRRSENAGVAKFRGHSASVAVDASGADHATELVQPVGSRVDSQPLSQFHTEAHTKAENVQLPAFAFIQARITATIARASQKTEVWIPIVVVLGIILLILLLWVGLFYVRGGTTQELKENPLASLEYTAGDTYRDAKASTMNARSHNAGCCSTGQSHSRRMLGCC